MLVTVVFWFFYFVDTKSVPQTLCAESSCADSSWFPVGMFEVLLWVLFMKIHLFWKASWLFTKHTLTHTHTGNSGFTEEAEEHSALPAAHRHTLPVVCDWCESLRASWWRSSGGAVFGAVFTADAWFLVIYRDVNTTDDAPAGGRSVVVCEFILQFSNGPTSNLPGRGISFLTDWFSTVQLLHMCQFGKSTIKRVTHKMSQKLFLLLTVQVLPSFSFDTFDL